MVNGAEQRPRISKARSAVPGPSLKGVDSTGVRRNWLCLVVCVSGASAFNTDDGMLVRSGQATVAGSKGLLFQLFAPGLGAGRRNFVSGFRFHCQLPPKTGEPFAARLDIVDGVIPGLAPRASINYERSRMLRGVSGAGTPLALTTDKPRRDQGPRMNEVDVPRLSGASAPGQY